MENKNIILVGVIVLLLACCCCAIVAALGGAVWFTTQSVKIPTATATRPAVVVRTPEPTATVEPGQPTPVRTVVVVSNETLLALENTILPSSNLRELAMRLQGVPDIPEIVSDTPADYQVGDEVTFNASDSDTDSNFTVAARLAYATENMYFFVDKRVQADDADVEQLVDSFQEQTYSTNREFFGDEWTPGVDGDPHIYVLYTQGLGASVGGYYSSADEYSKLANEYSNEKEMFYLNADSWTPLSDSYWPSAMAHEFQHMIHWHQDANEEGWLNEGASQLAELLNGYDVGYQGDFLGDPDLQLNTWSDLSNDPTEAGKHYSSSFLFMRYFLDRFGEEATRALIADDANGFRAIDNTLAALNLTDPGGSQTLTAADVFADWAVTNYLNDSAVAEGQYAYADYTDKVSGPTDTVSHCPDTVSTTVAQFGTDYYALECPGQLTVTFTGAQEAPVVPAAPFSGRYAVWGNRNDESDARMTREFDLTGLDKATLEFQGWWMIEKDWDYAYVVVSADGGATWKMLETPSGTDTDPVGNNFGWGFTGNSDGGDPADGVSEEWVKETVDLSEYAGQKILLRFEYVTDAALNYPGLLVDDIAVPELNYSCDFEADACGWEMEGFVRMDNKLPQTYIVQVIHLGDETTVERIGLDETNAGQFTLDVAAGETAVLVVSGSTLYTTEDASYSFEVR